MESCIINFNVNSLKSYFENSIENFNEAKFQRFLLTIISQSQFQEQLDIDEYQNSLMENSENLFQHII